MKRFPLFFIGGILLLLYLMGIHDRLILVKDIRELAYPNYNDLAAAVISRGTLLLFFFLIGLSQFPWGGRGLRHSGGLWLAGFLSVLIPLLTLILYVNPHALFPWNNLPVHMDPAIFIPVIRAQKIQLLDELESAPELIVLGSSRSFSISSAYLEEHTGLRTFNMAVNGGMPSDFLALGQYALGAHPSPPRVLIIELLMPKGDGDRDTLLPVALLPYIEPARRLDMLENITAAAFSAQAVSDSIYQITYARAYPVPPEMTFLADGTGVRAERTDERYDIEFARVANRINRSKACLTDRDKDNLEQLILIALERDVAILFYRSPLNPEFLERADTNFTALKQCDEQFAEYMAKLRDTYPNVSFRDLTYYEPVASLRREGFVDVHHLTPAGSRLLVDALLPDIHAAAQWSLQEARK